MIPHSLSTKHTPDKIEHSSHAPENPRCNYAPTTADIHPACIAKQFSSHSNDNAHASVRL